MRTADLAPPARGLRVVRGFAWSGPISGFRDEPRVRMENRRGTNSAATVDSGVERVVFRRLLHVWNTQTENRPATE
jgi:hypothetical protein